MKEKSIVFVRISAQAGKGKTTIAVKLSRILKKLGIECEVWEYDDSYQQNISDEHIDKNLVALGGKVKVIVQTEQLKRHCV